MSEQIVTGVDRLLALVNERAEITLTAAANHLQTDRTVVEEWSKTLEEAGLISMRQALSDRFLRSRDWDHKDVSVRALLNPLPFFNARPFNEAELSERERRVNESLKLLSESMQRLEKYKTFKAEAEHLRHDVSLREERLTRELRGMEKTRKLIQKEGAMAEKIAKKLSSQATKLAEREKALQEKKRGLAHKEKVLNSFRKHLNRREKRLETAQAQGLSA